MKERIVLAYAGGLQTSVAIPWLAEASGAEVVTLTLDLGQGRDLEEIRDRALATGAVRAHVLDVREEFARDFVLPALQAGALQEGCDPMAAALGRPLIAKKLLEIASIEQATAIAHGGTGIDEKRMDATARALNPAIRVIAAARAAETLPAHHANLWGRAYTVTKPPAKAPDTPAYVEISFERGVPAAINGVPMALTELIESLSIIAGQHGVGRIAVTESDVAGARVRHVYEAPAAVVLHAALRVLETSVLPRDLTRLKSERAAEYADLVGNGLWFTPMRDAMDAFNAELQKIVSGSVRIKLFKGALTSEAAALDHAAVPLR
jgi:argininosuccinate synthase